MRWNEKMQFQFYNSAIKAYKTGAPCFVTQISILQ